MHVLFRFLYCCQKPGKFKVNAFEIIALGPTVTACLVLGGWDVAMTLAAGKKKGKKRKTRMLSLKCRRTEHVGETFGPALGWEVGGERKGKFVPWVFACRVTRKTFRSTDSGLESRFPLASWLHSLTNPTERLVSRKQWMKAMTGHLV